MASWPYKIKVFVLFAVAYWVCYVIPNFFSAAPAAILPFTPIDTFMPFLPATFLIYTSDYLLFAIAIAILYEKPRFNSFVRMMFLTLFLCGIVFRFFPTTYPRPEYPQDSWWPIQALMDFITVADSPRNCFPSMHVGLTAVATWSLRYKGPKVFLVFAAWSVAIFVSTLTTKQHYFVDIIGGLTVMVLAATAEFYLFEQGKLAAIAQRITRQR